MGLRRRRTGWRSLLGPRNCDPLVGPGGGSLRCDPPAELMQLKVLAARQSTVAERFVLIHLGEIACVVRPQTGSGKTQGRTAQLRSTARALPVASAGKNHSCLMRSSDICPT